MQGLSPLKGATASDIATYNRHWTKVMVNSDYDGADCVYTTDARRYLAAEVAHKGAVDRILTHLGATETTRRETFEQALHLLYLAVRGAQEAMFTTDDPTLWSDAAPASGGKPRDHEDKQQAWVIGTVAAAHGISTDAGEEEDGDDGWGAIAAGHAPRHIENDTPLNVLRHSPSSSEAAISIGTATTKSSGHERNSSNNLEWSAFDAAFSNLHVGEKEAAEETTVAPPAWGQHRQQLSLAGVGAKLATVPGTALLPIAAGERQRYEDAFKTKGFEGAGGLQESEARSIFERARLSSITFEHLWNLSNITGGGALDSRQFCLFMHLIKAAVEGQQLPETISQVTAAQFLGDIPLSYGAPADTLRVDANRIKAALHPEDAPPVIDRSLLPGARPTSPGGASSNYDDDSDLESEVSHVSVSCWHMGMGKGTPSPNSLHKVSSRSGFITPRGVTGSSLGSSNTSPVPETTRIERAAWEAEAGVGHSSLELRLGTANLMMQRRAFNQPIITLTLMDPVGRLVEMPLESHPGVPNADAGCIEFREQKIRMKTPLRQFPPGSTLFLEIKQWKAEKQRFSTVAWAFVDTELMIDAGPVCSRVRCGPMILPLFKKPMDTSLQKLKRLGGRTVVLHMYVLGRR